MPVTGHPIHLEMLKKQGKQGEIYGLNWGNPDVHPRMIWVRDTFCIPFVDPDGVAVEIGPGGGRWTQYLAGFKKLYAVDLHQELLDELAKNFDLPNIEMVLNAGADLPGVPDQSVDFVYSFGVFVHLELDVIDGYLSEIKRVLKPDTGTAVLQYSDKNKKAAKENKGFSDNTPQKMRALLRKHGFWIDAENLTALNHSAIVRFSNRTDLP